MNPRDDLIDALRGFALFGILAVNIQCFVTGLGAPSLGILDAHSSRADHVVVWLTAFLLEFKFYPIFSFCFGYGFALQMRRWKIAGVPLKERFGRRMNAMLFMGLMHGTLLWFGDILTRYALTGYVLRQYAGCGPRKLLDAAKFWLAIAVGLLILFAMLSIIADSSDTAAELAAAKRVMREDASRVITAYAASNYVDATIQRIVDFKSVTLNFIVLIPHLMTIFLFGALAAQLGLLRDSARHREVWKKLWWFGVGVGVPVNMIHAGYQLHASQNPWVANTSVIALVAGELAPILAIAIVASFALYGARSGGQRVVTLLAPAGRIALTLYVCQSIAMAILLSGFGFGLGATLRPAGLFATAAAIYVALIALSHAMWHLNIRGPLEVLWRRYTYARIETRT